MQEMSDKGKTNVAGYVRYNRVLQAVLCIPLSTMNLYIKYGSKAKID